MFSFIQNISTLEWLRTSAIALTIFTIFGTFTALWNNPFFVRMTPTGWLDFALLGMEAILLGLFFGVKSKSCLPAGQAGVNKKVGAGGVLGFLGFGCSICNKILVLLFGTSFLLAYFEPMRYWVGATGILFLIFAVQQKLLLNIHSPTYKFTKTSQTA